MLGNRIETNVKIRPVVFSHDKKIDYDVAVELLARVHTVYEDSYCRETVAPAIFVSGKCWKNDNTGLI